MVVVIVDGLGDLPIRALDGDTPLEAAPTPVMDQWVEDGQCGLVDPLEPGVTVETHAGTGTLFGIAEDAVTRLARGPIEAAGAGVELQPGDVALRCNFATLEREDGTLHVRDRRAGRILEGQAELAEAFNGLGSSNGITTVLTPLSQHRAVLRLSGEGLSAAITDSDPGSGAGAQTLLWSRARQSGDVAAERTAEAVNRALLHAHEVFAHHPVNRERVREGLPQATGLLTRGAGAVTDVESMVVSRGLRGAVVGADRTVLGLGALLGYTSIVRPSFTGLLETDLAGKVAAARDALDGHDIVWLHAKGSDIAAHDRRPRAKRDYIAQLDSALAPLAEEDVVIAVTADHTTDSNTGRHTSDPVPALVWTRGGRRDAVKVFGERGCMRGGLGRLRAREFLRVVLSTAGALREVPASGRPAARPARDKASGDPLP
ncbi:MAG: alkaline phosphatase family protein [Planctomycetota bacterium]|nr:alkaline phosphatase family protein [Planctomycetota bacterium]